VVAALLIGAGLLLHSFWHIQHVDLGFKADDVITMQIRVLNMRYRQRERLAAFEQELLTRVRELPGVTEASLTNAVPMRGTEFQYMIGPKGERRRPRPMRAVDPEYFNVMRIPLRAGRFFGTGDSATNSPVAIVSESFARSLFRSGNALGERIDINNKAVEIVGIVGDVRAAEVTREAAPSFYLPRG